MTLGAIIGNIGSPHSTDVWCPHDIGREVWEWVGQESEVWQDPTPRTKCANVAGVLLLSEVRTRWRLGEVIIVVVVVECYCFLKIIIDVVRRDDVGTNILCFYILWQHKFQKRYSRLSAVRAATAVDLLLRVSLEPRAYF